jgi:putative Mn2+ efflux pump MntP
MILLLLLAFALASDAFAVALVQGAAVRPGIAGAGRIALAFGIAQALMPLFGWGLGIVFQGTIEAVDHWIAFVLLGALGLKMIHEGFGKDPEGAPALLSGKRLIGAAVATSIDAAAAGVTLPTLGFPIVLACAVIGGITAALCFAGALFGRQLGTRFGHYAEIAGGLVLIALGVKILVEHLTA